ncbi:MAG: phosphonoacetaldehyde reductase [Ruminiclostridium sp.]|nr:phosphonoacetaldehyde reductase [Ruminiclostridium sp.]
MEQIVYSNVECYSTLLKIITENKIESLMLVCDGAFEFLKIKNDIERLKTVCKIYSFSDFTPNPTYESVCKGVNLFNNTGCKALLAIGGGSTIDVAKCIKLFSSMDSKVNYLEQKIVENSIPLIAIPTTAGTGSEATRYSVIYYDGEKQSVTDDSSIPGYVFLLPELLSTLPLKQKKATMLDAFCHAVESFWSVNSNEESKCFSADALKLIMKYSDEYLNNSEEGNKNMLIAANLAGKAINITQTTAGHAMCYKITSIFGIPHGLAAAYCLPKLWRFMLDNMDRVCDSRGKHYLEDVFDNIAKCMNVDSPIKAVEKIENLLSDMKLVLDISLDDNQLETLVKSVNTTRLKNNPVALNEEDIRSIYIEVFRRN